MQIGDSHWGTVRTMTDEEMADAMKDELTQPGTEWADRARDAIGDAQHLIHQEDFMTAVHALVRAAAACHEAEAAKQRARRRPAMIEQIDTVCDQLRAVMDVALADVHASLSDAERYRAARLIDEARGHIGNALNALRRSMSAKTEASNVDTDEVTSGDGIHNLVALFCPRCGGKMGQVETADFCLQCDFVEVYP